MKITSKSRGANTRKNIYTSYTKAHLEFAAPDWNAYAKGDIEKCVTITSLHLLTLYSI